MYGRLNLGAAAVTLAGVSTARTIAGMSPCVRVYTDATALTQRASELLTKREAGSVSGIILADGRELTCDYVPLFDGGALDAALLGAEAGLDEARAQLAGALRQGVREVEEALVALDATAARRADAEAAARDFEAALQATEARQRGGLASLFELEDARRSALAAQSALIELDRERATAWVSLARALGGGWTTEAQQP